MVHWFKVEKLIILVCYAKCKTYEGKEGIIIEDKLKSFILITKCN
jgi:hypothetical protein